MISTEVGAIAINDQTITGHLKRSARYAGVIGARLGLCDAELSTLQYGAFLHDIGKVGVDASILSKAGPLTAEEYRVVQEHPIIGARMVQLLPLGRAIAPLVRHHHERWDGSGYPDGLARESIPLGARIVAIADAFDAMTTQRCYNQALSADMAMTRLCVGAGKYWDSRIVAIFVAWLQSPYLGSGVDL